MSSLVLDTDALLLGGNANLCARAAPFASEDLSVTIITVEETLTG